MNSAQAKKISLQEILLKLGYQPFKRFKGGEELAYLSPFRAEKEPSLFVNVRKNVWNDFGDIGGNALDFVIRYNNTDVKGALAFLDKMFGGGFVPPVQIHKQPEDLPKENVFLLDSTAPFGWNKNALFNYITIERGINPDVAIRYLKEVRFSNKENGKQYFAAGLENLSGGFEIRNPFFKGSIGLKDMSFFKGTGAGREVWVFEGLMDFLSKLTFENAVTVSPDCLVLNSTSYIEKAIEYIRSSGYSVITGYIDNDRAGDESRASVSSG